MSEEEITEQQALQGAADALRVPAAESEETEEVAEEEAPVELKDVLELGEDDKRTLGRVKNIQSKTDTNEAKLSGLESQVQKLTDALQRGLEPKPLDSEGLTQGLTRDDGVEFFKQQARMANDDMRQELAQLKTQQAELAQSQNSIQEQNDYANELMELAGDNWNELEGTVNDILEEIDAGVERGNSRAIQIKQRLQGNPEYLHGLAVKASSSNVRKRAAAHEAGVDAQAESTKSVSEQAAPASKSETLTENQANEGALSLLKG